MSKAEILDEIPKLKPEDRAEIRRKLDEFDGIASLEDDDLTPEEWALIDKRLAEHDADPQSAIPWEKVKAQLEERFGR